MSANLAEYPCENPERILKNLEDNLPEEDYWRDGLVIRENTGYLTGSIVAGLASREGEPFGTVFAYKESEFPSGIEEYLDFEEKTQVKQ